MIVRSTVYSSPGGDTTQIEMTAKYLRRLGVSVDIRLSNEKIEYSSYNLVHFFNIIRPDDILIHIPHLACPFVVSTIYVDFSEFEKRNRKGLSGLVTKIFTVDQVEYLKTVARFFKNGEKIKSFQYFLMGQKRSVQYVAKKAALLLPNSNSEYSRFTKSYSVYSPYKKVVNAIDASLFQDAIVANNEFDDHIICVGRIEGRKNQLNLIKAVEGTNLKLTIIGKPSPNHIEYYNCCRREASKNELITFVEHVPHDELPGIYKAAKVHVLASWFETTGLSSLEAGVMGCNIVITKKGDTEEYFQNMAFYCEPDNVASIRDAILAAYSSPPNVSLRNYIANNLTWENTAKQTMDAYNSL